MIVDRTPIKELARGRWVGILTAVGVDRKFLVNRHGPCPLCGGRDRFRFDDKDGRGTWICNRCGSGDGLDMVMRLHRLPFRDAAREVEGLAGKAPVTPASGRVELSAEQVTARVDDMWSQSQPICSGDPAANWLLSRIGVVSAANDLGWARDLPYAGWGRWPAMLALVRDQAGKPVNVHRTYLANSGDKAGVPQARKLLNLPFPKGAAVRLAPAGPHLGIAEGIETALAAGALFGLPCWAALTAGNLEGWTPPADVQRVTIFGDNDQSYTGQAAAFALAKRLVTARLDVTVEIPSEVGDDWNDVHQGREVFS